MNKLNFDINFFKGFNWWEI